MQVVLKAFTTSLSAPKIQKAILGLGNMTHFLSKEVTKVTEQTSSNITTRAHRPIPAKHVVAVGGVYKIEGEWAEQIVGSFISIQMYENCECSKNLKDFNSLNGTVLD